MHPETRKPTRRFSGGRSMPCRSIEQRQIVDADGPRDGLVIPAIALITLVLPAPERPNRPTMGASAANLTCKMKRAELLLDVNVRSSPCSRLERRVSHSEVARPR